MSRGYDEPSMSVNMGDGVSVMMDGVRNQKQIAVAKADKHFAAQCEILGPITDADRSWAAVELEMGSTGKVIDFLPVGRLSADPAPEPVDHNPKRGEGRKKPCVQFIPPVAIIEEARVMQMGAEKYGPFNWQDKPIDASTYYDAIMRHLLQWFTGEDIDPDSPSQTLHLAAIRASCGILIDAYRAGTLIDDRPRKAAKVSPVIAEHVATTA